MALTVWTQPSGSLGTFQEGLEFNLQLPVTNDNGVTYTKISGELPNGLWLKDNYIVGAPYEVMRDTISSFCIRASKDNQISDRTFYITITGADDPVILTTAGLLDIGIHKQLYVVDNTYITYQLSAIDSDTIAGQKLTYFISSGSLPPGLSLTEDGIIHGVTQSVTSLSIEEGNGTYDYGYYDLGPFDFAEPHPENGYDNLRFDYVGYDYFFVNQPKSINRFYNFIVSVTDGNTTSPAHRQFQIYVVSPRTFRADSSSLITDDTLFSADVSYVQVPVWVTPANLGTYRANNYVTFVLDVYDPTSVYYEIDDINKLPPNMSFNSTTGEIFGKVPAQSAITITYSFTITAVRIGDADTTENSRSSRTFTVDIIGEIESVITWNTPSDLGHISAEYVSTLKINATSSIPNATITYVFLSGSLPPGLSLMYDGEISGSVKQYPNSITFDHNTLTFDNGLTTIVTATESKSNTVVNVDYTFIFTDTQGVTIFDGNTTKITTKIKHRSIVKGLTTFDLGFPNRTTFDNNATTIDRTYTFTVNAHDQYYLSAVSKTFTITVDTPNLIEYSNIYVKPFMTPDHRSTWSKFINDPAIFTSTSIYRQSDPNFGIQYDLAMLIYAGIETKPLAEYSELTNESVKRFRFGNVEKAIAYYPGTKTPVYEVIYVNMIDPLLENTTYATDNVTQWRSDILNLGSSKWDYLPLWMRSVQPLSRKQLGFVLGVPLCFCQNGSADGIMLNIKYSNFDFKLLDYTVDRFIISKVTGYDADKYIVFKNRNYK